MKYTQNRNGIFQAKKHLIFDDKLQFLIILILARLLWLNNSQVSFLELTSTGVIWGEMVLTAVELEPFHEFRGRHINQKAT
jgi:hypothetical protein